MSKTVENEVVLETPVIDENSYTVQDFSTRSCMNVSLEELGGFVEGLFSDLEDIDETTVFVANRYQGKTTLTHLNGRRVGPDEDDFRVKATSVVIEGIEPTANVNIYRRVAANLQLDTIGWVSEPAEEEGILIHLPTDSFSVKKPN